jgi:hypothetical protein
MNRHDFLSGMHDALSPRSYLAIGVDDGQVLAASHTRTIGVDPEPSIAVELACELELVKASSSEFFARPDALGWFADGVIDLALIDGPRIAELALRDFISIERASARTSVVLLSAALPRSSAEAARDRVTSTWAGDVYKVGLVLAKHRPDLVVVPLNTDSTGLLLVVGLDAASTVLADHYDEIVAEIAVPDPQAVPQEVTHRTTAADPAAVLASPLWRELAAARATGELPASARDLLELRGKSGYVWSEPAQRAWSAGEVMRKPPVAKPAAAKRPAKKTAAKKTATKPAAKRGLLHRVRKAIKRRL